MNHGAGSPVDDGRPLFRQIADLVEAGIVDGTYAEDRQVPSTNELAAFHRINPATAAKGLQQLLADGTLEKRRGIGMFVTPGAREKLVARRRGEFAEEFVRPMVDEARMLGIDRDGLVRMIDELSGEGRRRGATGAAR
jgi:DNA-binding transcriptional regulator YhcF (GntR family)